MASPLMRMASDEASSSRASSSARSRSARTRSRRNWNGRVTTGSVGGRGRLLTGAGRLFDGLGRDRFGVVAAVGVERLHAQGPLAVDEDEAPGAVVAAVHEQVGRLVGLGVEVDDRALRHADDERGGHAYAPDLGP